MKKEWPLVSIITVNYNHSHETCEMLDSLQAISYSNYECIVVDNASPDDDIFCIPKGFPEVIFVESKENLGFAGGNNLGIEYAKGEIYLFLNFDSVVHPNFLEPLVEELQKDGIGMVGPKICYYHDKELLQFAGYTPMHPLTLRNRSIGYKERDSAKYKVTYDSSFVHGAAMAVNASAVRQVGLMPDIYFLYYEELDWAESFRKHGYKIKFVGHSTIYHKASVSTGQDSPLKIYYLARNRIMFARRHSRIGMFLLSMIFQYGVALPKNLLTYAFSKKWTLLSAYAKGAFWHIPNLFNPRIKQTYPSNKNKEPKTSSPTFLL